MNFPCKVTYNDFISFELAFSKESNNELLIHCSTNTLTLNDLLLGF
jgi:hypothetical protein